MKEFNYKRAWKEAALPVFRTACDNPLFRAAWLDVVRLSPDIRQTNHSTNRLRRSDSGDDEAMAAPASMVALAASMDTGTFSKLASMVNFFGHWADAPVCARTTGATWKFQKFAFQCGAHEDNVTGRAFMDHKPGSGYDNEEVTEILNGWLNGSGLRVERVQSVNHKVEGYSGKGHPFVIGPEHFPKDGGMFIQPEQAGCNHCGMPHAAHTHETAAMLKGTKAAGDEVTHKALKALLAKIETHNTERPAEPIKLDGFGLLS